MVRFEKTKMVRTTSSLKCHKVLGVYKHRSSVYQKRAGYIDMPDVELLFAADKKPETQDQDEAFILPPKRPTPNVILRSDIMPKQRFHSVL